MVFIRPPGVQEGGFTLAPDRVWYARVMLLFSIQALTDDGLKDFNCAFVSVLEDFKASIRPGTSNRHFSSDALTILMFFYSLA
jgi:hypothetical protein